MSVLLACQAAAANASATSNSSAVATCGGGSSSGLTWVDGSPVNGLLLYQSWGADSSGALMGVSNPSDAADVFGARVCVYLSNSTRLGQPGLMAGPCTWTLPYACKSQLPVLSASGVVPTILTNVTAPVTPDMAPAYYQQLAAGNGSSLLLWAPQSAPGSSASDAQQACG